MGRGSIGGGVMPIKRSHCPDNREEIAEEVKGVAAGGCQGILNQRGQLIGVQWPGFGHEIRILEAAQPGVLIHREAKDGATIARRKGRPHEIAHPPFPFDADKYRPPVTVVLSVCHLDHDPEDSFDPANLAALCQRCRRLLEENP